MISPLFIISTVFMLAGLIMAKWPPKKINPLYGYRTRRSMQTIEAWKYAQKLASRKMVLCGLIGFAIGLIAYVSNVGDGIHAILMLATLFGTLWHMFYTVENNLKKKFPQPVA